jgi:predicted nucleic acid-binding protein
MYFLDTSYVLALELENDQYHHLAQQHWQGIRVRLPPILTSTYVFDEIVTFFNSRGYHKKAVEVGTMLLTSPSIAMVHVEEHLFHEAWNMFVQHDDKRFSLTDCVSFELMKTRQIIKALSFDHHFVQAGFQKEPNVETYR